MDPIGNSKTYQIDYSDSGEESERDEMEDLVGSLDDDPNKRTSLERKRTRTCCSTCSCSGTPLWQPPDDPTQINMLDVP